MLGIRILENTLGNRRMAPDFQSTYRINLKKITPYALGNEVDKIKNGRALHNQDKTSVQALKAAIDFMPKALEDGADLENAVFLFALAGREFVVQAGSGDWEYYFTGEYPGQITGRCVRKPWLNFIWEKVLSFVTGYSRTLMLTIDPLAGMIRRLPWF